MQNPLPNSLYHSRKRPRKPDLRGDYFRDQTAIIHASPFRRLKHKTQVFFSPQDDHICTRMEHVLHVSTIATTICKGLELDVELAQAIALGHDLGHAPFGHVGEKVLNDLAADSGGFIHEVHSLRVVDRIAQNGEGLNLTYAVRDGIVSHCGEHFQQTIAPFDKPKNLESISDRQDAPLTYEGCVVRVADKIAYLGRDIEDAISAGLITPEDVPRSLKRNLGSTNGEIIDCLVKDVVEASSGGETIAFSDSKFRLICELKEFNYEKIYNHPFILENDVKIAEIITTIFGHLADLFKKNQFDAEAYSRSPIQADRHFGEFMMKRTPLYRGDLTMKKAVVDFVAGMTDSYALQTGRELLLPQPLGFH
jgi:dGTPase